MTVRNSQITIRIATAADAPAMITLINESFTVEDFLEGTRTDVVRMAKSMQSGQFLLAEDSAGKIVATVYIELHGERGYFGMLAVDPLQQGKGLGRAMIEAAENHGRKLGCRYMDINVLSQRERLPGYYRQFGYVETGCEPFHASERLRPGVECHRIVMSKDLSRSG